MENHYHLLLRTPQPTLREGMQRLNGSYAQGFNARHRLGGHVFEGRYTSVCRHPGDWFWSSYSGLVGMTSAPDFLACGEVRRLFDPVAERGASALRNFIANQL